MAPVQTTHRHRPGPLARPATAGHWPGHAHPPLAEVIPLRPTAGSTTSCTEPGLAGCLAKIAQVFASLRAQAASGDTSPRPPTSSAPFVSAPSHTAPDDAA